MVDCNISANGAQPTGTIALATVARINETASPNKKICTSWPPSDKALASRNGNADLVESSEPQALFYQYLLITKDIPHISFWATFLL
jgi:hypothetical protein